MRIFCVLFLLPLLLSVAQNRAWSQQQNFASEEKLASIKAGETYLNARTQALDKYLSRSERIYSRLQKKLERKEKKMLRRLARKDSTQMPDAYQPGLPAVDSIGTHSRLRSRSTAVTLVDSLRSVQQFMQQQSARLGDVGKVLPDGAYTEKLNQLQERLKAQEELKTALGKKGKQLEGLAGKKIKGVKGLQKDLYYATEQIRYWKDLSNEPDKAEEKALEYLMGTEGFVQALPDRNAGAFNGLGNNASPEDLARLGYQTKAKVNELMQQKFGDQLSGVQQQMGEQLQAYQEQLNGIKENVDDVKTGYSEARESATKIKQAASGLKHLSFKENSQRGKPFWQRFETEYNWQTARSLEERPAMLDLGVSVAYKPSPKFRIGIGLAGSLGLGRDWQHLKVTYEGLALRAFLDRELFFGISLQGGYERHFRPENRPYLDGVFDGRVNKQQATNPLREAFGGQQQVAYIGLMKRYRINDKWSGTFLIGYNFLWNQYDLRTPLLIRFGWEK